MIPDPVLLQLNFRLQLGVSTQTVLMAISTWEPAHTAGLWCCKVCPDYNPSEISRIPQHEKSARHQRNLERYDEDVQQQNIAGPSHLSSKSPPLGSSPNVHLRPETVQGPLGRTLAEIQTNPRLHQIQDNYVDSTTGVVNWEFADYDTHLGEAPDAGITAQLAHNLAAYLKDGDLEQNSDDKLEERSELDDSSDSNEGETKKS
ncbi:hypothetical protein B0H14DRAFT_2561834 [Mycena olivaceomarginata]|nr:hypothetical protein B0H14DRAFT_2561834 [Mycena olivaceomarginata]